MAVIQYLNTNDPIVDEEGFITVPFKTYMDLLLTRTGGIRGGSYLQLTDDASIVWDLEQKPVAFVVLGGNRAFPNPLNITPGLTYKLTIIQDATGNRLISSWGSMFKFPSGTAPTLSTAGNAVDDLLFSSDGTNLKLIGLAKDLR